MHFALKEICKLKIIDKHILPNIQKEINIQSKLWNDFIVNLLGSFQDKEKVYLVLEYFKGGDLRYHLQRQKQFNEGQTSKYILLIY